MYDEAAFNEQLNENMADDPYSTAMYLIVEAIKGAHDGIGLMNDYEASIFAELSNVIRDHDTATGSSLPQWEG
jgi:hypothetical protein